MQSKKFILLRDKMSESRHVYSVLPDADADTGTDGSEIQWVRAQDSKTPKEKYALLGYGLLALQLL